MNPICRTLVQYGAELVLAVFTGVCLFEKAWATHCIPPDPKLSDPTNWVDSIDIWVRRPTQTWFDFELCIRERRPELLGLTHMECILGRRMLLAALVGGLLAALVAVERRAWGKSSIPATCMTMPLVCVGSCIYCICSMHAFEGSPAAWDSNRVAQGVVKGMGFLGSALVWRGITAASAGTATPHFQVSGLVLAALIWTVVALGICVGTGMHNVAVVASLGVCIILHYSPRRRSGEPVPVFAEKSAAAAVDTAGAPETGRAKNHENHINVVVGAAADAAAAADSCYGGDNNNRIRKGRGRARRRRGGDGVGEEEDMELRHADEWKKKEDPVW